MASGGTGTQKEQLGQDNDWARNALGTYNSDIGSYNSNVNALLHAGNPYQSKEYLQNQNLETSGAMNAANTRAKQQLTDVTRRAGGSTSAIASTIADTARQGQRDLTNYNATRDTANEDKWLQEQQRLLGDQFQGAQSEAGIYGTSMGGANNALSNLTQRQDSEDAMWSNLAGAALGGAGLGAGIAMK